MTTMSTPKPSTPSRARRHDPERRQRLLAITLAVIAEHGVSGTTHRRVAAAADVPLGSMTYHFASRDALLDEAFQTFVASMCAHYDARLLATQSVAQMAAVVVDLICADDTWATERNLLLSYELYAYASRSVAARAPLREWLERTRTLLMRHVDKRTADALDALIEGYTIHRSIDRLPPTRGDIEDIVARVLRTP